MLLAVPLGRLADRIGRARVFLAGEAMLFGVFALLGAGLAGLAPLLLMLLLYGGFYAATDGIVIAMASAVLPRHLRTTGLAILGTADRVGSPPVSRRLGCHLAELGRHHGQPRLHDRAGAVAPRRRRAPAPDPQPDRRRRDPLVSRWRIIGFVVLCIICVGGAAAYLLTTDDPASSGSVPDGATPPSAASTDEVSALLAAPHVVYRDTDLGSGFGLVAVAPLDRPEAAVLTDLACERVDYSAGRGICLTVDRGAVTTYGATIFDQDLRSVATLDLPGLPSRTRVSADGRHGAMTNFVYGDSYAAATFSTRTQLLDLSTGESLGDLEQFTATKDGKVIDAADRNYWGVTFGTGDEFYATLQTGGRRYLVKGDLGTRSVEVVTDDVECPSLSPDGTRIAFKQRSTGALGQIQWRIAVLDLATLEVHDLAETANVDDQPEWLDDTTVLYGMTRGDGTSPTTDVWKVPADGRGSPELFLSGAWSPGVSRTPAEAGSTGSTGSSGST